MKYLDLLNQNAEETAKTNNSFVAESANISIQSALLVCKQKSAALKNDIDTAKRAIPFSAKTVVNLQMQLALNEKELVLLTELQKELF